MSALHASRLRKHAVHARRTRHATVRSSAEAGEGEDGRMKSAIGIGSLLLDGLGDTIRVSLTEDPERELDPCRRLADLGTSAVTEGWGVAPFGESTRDTHGFSRRHGALPEQRASDGDADYRNVLHRCAARTRSVAYFAYYKSPSASCSFVLLRVS